MHTEWVVLQINCLGSHAGVIHIYIYIYIHTCMVLLLFFHIASFRTTAIHLLHVVTVMTVVTTVVTTDEIMTDGVMTAMTVDIGDRGSLCLCQYFMCFCVYTYSLRLIKISHANLRVLDASCEFIEITPKPTANVLD